MYKITIESIIIVAVHFTFDRLSLDTCGTVYRVCTGATTIYIRMAIVLKFKPLTTTYIHSADVIFFSRVTAKSIWIERSLFRILAHIVSTHYDCTKVASFMHVP